MHFQCWKSTRRREKFLILWTLFSIQLLLIGFVLFGNNSNSLSDDIDDDSLQAYRSNNLPNPKIQRVVKFLKNDISLPNEGVEMAAAAAAAIIPTAALANKIVLPSLETFKDAYFECRSGKPANFTSDTLFCFRNSSVMPVSAHLRQMSDSFDEDEDCTCKCQAGYHGRDCSQPEVVWRAFWTAHLPKKFDDEKVNLLNDESEPKPRRIFYHIDSTTLSLTTVEIQVKELQDLVDLFIFCDEIRNATNAVHAISPKHERFRYHQQSSEHSSNFFLKKLKAKILIVETRHRCTPKATYKMFRNQLSDLVQGDEIYLYSSYDEILNRQAIQYIKWNSNWSQSQPLRFRLKYTVYGFYWQHPVQTVLSSAACQLHVLDELYKKDPTALLNTSTTGMIIGDLNHYGGWFCQYCYESSENIAQKVQRDRTMNASSPVFSPLFTNRLDNGDVHQQRPPNHIDAPHIESLISAGVYVDGKLELIRLHRYSDKYYAPDALTKEAWKYESLLTNTYAHYDGDVDE
ncbi:beta-1,4-mannosyl-glycoprotein 4-beta-N-acetylglucosaminyltransferase [Sitodiplosis mosellana]|uniref:beta-1,4-mannosyl-glycoprotein 4-beta-N-acetylglucosaminyltransferase n=1 Tax=Sitodiplosis mosellana TaxID=263140 RepID=UPI002443F465|nr:beta-1,4-mannosyl-glycoprotein 4-beta-N-acetylglucosaminyltransferase [Sitodiplosis mosellana]